MAAAVTMASRPPTLARELAVILPPHVNKSNNSVSHRSSVASAAYKTSSSRPTKKFVKASIKALPVVKGRLVSLTSAFVEDDTLQWLGGCFLVFVLGLTYQYGVVVAARTSVLWEIMLTCVVPFIGWLMFSEEKISEAPHRQGELILIELTFEAFVCLAKLFPQYSILANYAFCAFFVVQTAGFLRSEENLIPSELRSITLFMSICAQRWHYSSLAMSSDTATVVDADGRFLVFGKDAPPNIKLHYLFWLVGVLYVDYRSVLPHAALPALHFASFALAALSGEFWFVFFFFFFLT